MACKTAFRLVFHGQKNSYQMKIYTKKGDSGETSLLGGTRVFKNHIRIETYGTIDELNTHLGMLKSLPGSETHITAIERIQHYLFVMGSQFALDPEKATLKNGKDRLPVDNSGREELLFLEDRIDAMDRELPPLRNFLIPGGHQVVAQAHIARTVCRRAERRAVALYEKEAFDPVLLQYLNRLSDFLFVLARKLSDELNVAETPFKSRQKPRP